MVSKDERRGGREREREREREKETEPMLPFFFFLKFV
jgi:hypothetical protein